VGASRHIERLARPITLDLVEKVAISCLLGVLAARMIPVAISSGNILPILLVISETLVVVFILLRRSTHNISLSWRDWLFGFAGTVAPLLAAPASGTPIAPLALCGTLMMLGFMLNLSAKLTLRRSFGVVAANRGVKIGGPYRLVRHPMYAGYTLTQLGFLLSGPTLWNFGLYGLALSLQIARIRAEERILRNDPVYSEMSERVPYRLVPFIF
jgi:protein-S-isoprenylcysteine O-methyltransferase Ste14